MNGRAFDPEVVELLKVVAADPRSGILHAPREPLLRWAGRTEETISAGSSYLTRAERHLVMAYREEVAELIYWMAIWRVTFGGSGGSMAFLRKAKHPEPSALRESAKANAGSDGARMAIGEQVVSLLLEFERTSASRLAAAAMRLRPNDLSRIVLGHAFHSEKQTSSALRTFNAVIARTTSAEIRSYALENLGMVFSAKREFGKALQCNAQAVHQTPYRVAPRVWFFSMAIQLGNEAEVRRSAIDLEEVPEHHGTLEEVLGLMERARIAGSWKATEGARQLVRSMGESLPPRAMKICDVFGKHP